ncbi:hypothetical protein [Deinococcus sonorensis]|uniref:Uncharacterized protein n=2 Tax=Deinococcus sonorensis TaxID=309891 RepID=A0AAU7UEL4_9DEIO
MKAARYIITRPCLAEGSLRLLKYLEPLFSEDPSETFTFQDLSGRSYPVTPDRPRARLLGMGELYRAHHLGVNDVLLITAQGEGRYLVDCVVKPLSRPVPGPASSAPARPTPPPTTRVVVSASPYVREVRMERRVPDAPPADLAPEPRRRVPEPAPSDVPQEQPAPAAEARRNDAAAPAVARRPQREPQPAAVRGPVPVQRPPEPVTERERAVAVQVQPAPKPAPLPEVPVLPVAPAAVQTLEEQLSELARLTGYRCQHLGGGVVRLHAELGPHGYQVLLATSEAALQAPGWQEPCDYKALITEEHERPQGVPRFTREALFALLEHARLAPLSPVDLRGYWNTGSFDQESVASVAELVSAHLAQRGSFSHVLMTLAQQPAHSLVALPRLAERLGSGVNTAELQDILETLTRPPFLALTPLPGGQYYLRSDMRALLTDLGEYADGMRRRLKPQAQLKG